MIWIILIIIIVVVIINNSKKKKATKDPYQGAGAQPPAKTQPPAKAQPPVKKAPQGKAAPKTPPAPPESGTTAAAAGGSGDALSADAFARAFAHMHGGEDGGSGKGPEPAPAKPDAPEKTPAPVATPTPAPAPAKPGVVPPTPAEEAAERDAVRSNPVTANIMMDWYSGWGEEESTYQEMISAGVAYFTLTVQADRIVQEMFLKKGGSATTDFPFATYDPGYTLDTPAKQDELYQLIGTILDSQATITWENKERFVLKQIAGGSDPAESTPAPAEPEPEAPAASSLEAQLQAMLQNRGKE